MTSKVTNTKGLTSSENSRSIVSQESVVPPLEEEEVNQNEFYFDEVHRRLNENSDNAFLAEDHSIFDEEEENTARNDVENRQNTTKPSTVPNVPMRKVSLEREIGYEKRNSFLFHVRAKT